MFVSRYLYISSMETIAHQLLSQELNSDTEQSGEGPGQSGGITRSVIATQKSILRHVDYMWLHVLIFVIFVKIRETERYLYDISCYQMWLILCEMFIKMWNWTLYISYVQVALLFSYFVRWCENKSINMFK